MQRTHIRNLFYIYRIKIAFVLLIVAASCSLGFSQGNNGNYNYLGFEQKPYYFGITLAYNTANYKGYLSNDFILNDSIGNVLLDSGPGFNLGIVTNLKVGRYFDLRLLPTLSFSERNFEYFTPSESLFDNKKIESVIAEIPFHIRYKSEPWNDVRVFVVAGAKYSFDVASESKAREAFDIIKVTPNDFSIEIGAGIQFFLPYFIFSPEIKFTHGLSNVLQYDNELLQSRVLEKLIPRTFTISLHFEG